MTGGYGNGPDIISSCSVKVEKGEIVSILGPNGAGKSTAMKAMLGLLNLKTGSIIILPDLRFNNPNIAFMAVDFPAPLGPRIETISPRLTFTEQEEIISGPFPYPPVIFMPSKKAINLFP